MHLKKTWVDFLPGKGLLPGICMTTVWCVEYLWFPFLWMRWRGHLPIAPTEFWILSVLLTLSSFGLFIKWWVWTNGYVSVTFPDSPLLTYDWWGQLLFNYNYNCVVWCKLSVLRSSCYRQPNKWGAVCFFCGFSRISNPIDWLLGLSVGCSSRNLTNID